MTSLTMPLSCAYNIRKIQFRLRGFSIGSFYNDELSSHLNGIALLKRSPVLLQLKGSLLRLAFSCSLSPSTRIHTDKQGSKHSKVFPPTISKFQVENFLFELADDLLKNP